MSQSKRSRTSARSEFGWLGLANGSNSSVPLQTMSPQDYTPLRRSPENFDVIIANVLVIWKQMRKACRPMRPKESKLALIG